MGCCITGYWLLDSAHNDYPLAPENIPVATEDLSSYQRTTDNMMISKANLSHTQEVGSDTSYIIDTYSIIFRRV
jgi:hypothetical protein